MRIREYTWKSKLQKHIEEHWKPGECFTFAGDISKLEEDLDLKKCYPDNHNIQHKLYEIMFQLRRDRFIESIEPGRYCRL